MSKSRGSEDPALLFSVQRFREGRQRGVGTTLSADFLFRWHGAALAMSLPSEQFAMGRTTDPETRRTRAR